MHRSKRAESSTRRVDELLAFDSAMPFGLPDTAGESASLFSCGDASERPGAVLVGFDEAGRGAVAGPVVVGCVAFDLHELRTSSRVLDALADVDDSKRLSAAKRERAFDQIDRHACWSVGSASSIEIDRLGIVDACAAAAARAYAALGREADIGLFDRGLALRPDGCAPPGRTVSLTRGDARSLHIAAASIMAKVFRDRVLCRLDERLPQYGLAANKGYGTRAHRAAVLKHGPTWAHRRSFVRGWALSTENTVDHQFR